MFNKSKKPVIQFSCEEEAEFRRALDAIPPPPPPDGGWGWMIVLGAFFINFIVDGVCFSFGVLLPHLLTVDNSRCVTSLIGSLLLGCCLLSGPLTSALANRYGCRRVAVVGAFAASGSFIAACLSPTTLALVLSYGAAAGFGCGMMYLPSILCVGLYFERRRALATAVAVCGSGIGTLVFAPAGALLLDKYEWRGVVVLIAGLAANGIVASCLFRPLDKDLQRRRKVILRKMEADKRMGPQTCLIMRRLMMDKDRQRTLSTGSLNNACITFDNNLVRSDEVVAEVAVAQEEWVKLKHAEEQQRRMAQMRVQQQQLRKRTHSASLLEWMPRGSSARSSLRVPPQQMLCKTPEPMRRDLAVVPAAPQASQPQRPMPSAALRQIKSVGGRLCEHNVNCGAAAPAAAIPNRFNVFMRDSFRNLLAGRLLPRNANGSSNGVRLSPLLQQEQQPEAPLDAPSSDQEPLEAAANDGLGIDNPVANLTDGDVTEPTAAAAAEVEPIASPPVIIAIPDDADDESSAGAELDDEERRSSSAEQSPLEAGCSGGCPQAEEVQAGCSSIGCSALPLLQLPAAAAAADADDLPDSPAVLLAVSHLKKQLQKQDAPMYRQDIFYSGSVVNLPQYRAAADVDAYVKSITCVPPPSELRRTGSVRSSASSAAVSSVVSASTAPAPAAAAATAAVAVQDACSTYSEPTHSSGPIIQAIERFVSWLPDTFVDVVSTTLDFRTLASPTFLLFITSTVLTMLGFFAPFAFLMEAAVETGVAVELAPYLVSVLGVSNTVGRVAAGALAAHAWVDCLIVNDIVLVVAGGVTLLLPLCSSFYLFAICAAVYGICIATFVSLRSVIVVELMGLEKLTSAYSQLVIFQGVAVILGTSAAGYLRDITGDYVLTFYSAGAVIAVSGLLCLPLRYVAKWEQRRASRPSQPASSVSRERLRIESTSASAFSEELTLGQSAGTTFTDDVEGSVKRLPLSE